MKKTFPDYERRMGFNWLAVLMLAGLMFSAFPVIAQQGGTGDGVDEDGYSVYGIYRRDAPRAERVAPATTVLPLEFRKGQRIGFVGNTLLEREQLFGYIETILHQLNPEANLVIRNFAWSADTPDLQPRPDNFADLDQHLTYEKIDIILAAFGFNESFAGPEGVEAFIQSLTVFVDGLKRSAFNGRSGPQIVLISPTANENTGAVAAADMNNPNIRLYTDAMRKVALEQQVGFIDVFDATARAMESPATDLTFNGVHMVDAGYALFGRLVGRALTGRSPATIDERIRTAVIDKNRQYFRRYRPLNTYYYTGARNKSYGYLDFLPAMRNFEIMTRNRDRRIWELASGMDLPPVPLEEILPEMPETDQSRGANEWLSPDDERAAFKVDPRFEVELFASEVEFPEIACPIQMRWDTRGRMWVSCSTTYPHVYPGNEPNDRIVILEDTDLDGKADKSTIFADNLQIPLSFELGDGGVYVSEEPHLVFLKDTDGDDRADFRRILFTGFGCEDSHHALHDFVWMPDGDLLFRESIFHNSQVETPYGPVRAKNSAWFVLQPESHRLTSFGSYPNTNPWGVTFDNWGYHVASHPIFAAAFHATNPPYPSQYPRARGIPAYSGVCGHEFVDFDFWPEEMQRGFVKVRYKPTNRVEFHKWIEQDDHFKEDYQGDILFSTNLSFIPVDLKYGPRGAMYVVDWYNPVKGHMQYSLRDRRRDRSSGRIWRIVPSGVELPAPVLPAGKQVSELLNMLELDQYRLRYLTRKELRERPAQEVLSAIPSWLKSLNPAAPHYQRHQLEALWLTRSMGGFNKSLWNDLLKASGQHARAAAVRMLRHWHSKLTPSETTSILGKAANDPSQFVRMEAAIAASYIGTEDSLKTVLSILDQPMGNHLKYAMTTALGSEALRRHWLGNRNYAIVPDFMADSNERDEFAPPTPNASEAAFDSRKDLAEINISCVPERMRFTRDRFTVKAGQPVKIVFTNPDATDHNIVIASPGSMEAVGTAANEMARDPENMKSDFIPASMKSSIIAHSRMIGPMRKSRVDVIRFTAPTEPGEYPYLCTFPGHWVIMNGVMVVE